LTEKPDLATPLTTKAPATRESAKKVHKHASDTFGHHVREKSDPSTTNNAEMGKTTTAMAKQMKDASVQKAMHLDRVGVTKAFVNKAHKPATTRDNGMPAKAQLTQHPSVAMAKTMIVMARSTKTSKLPCTKNNHSIQHAP
jgi:hypothetical protein